MIDQINKAFAEVDTQIIESHINFANKKLDGAKEYADEMRVRFKKGEVQHLTSGYGRFCEYTAKVEWFGSKAMYALLSGRGREGALEKITEVAKGKIEKRNHKIIKALNKKGINEIDDFELTHFSDGYEGIFFVDGHEVVIKTFLAGGHNVQCLHIRTTVKVK